MGLTHLPPHQIRNLACTFLRPGDRFVSGDLVIDDVVEELPGSRIFRVSDRRGASFKLVLRRDVLRDVWRSHRGEVKHDPLV